MYTATSLHMGKDKRRYRGMIVVDRCKQYTRLNNVRVIWQTLWSVLRYTNGVDFQTQEITLHIKFSDATMNQNW